MREDMKPLGDKAAHNECIVNSGTQHHVLTRDLRDSDVHPTRSA
jgi:hypothetical protein